MDDGAIAWLAESLAAAGKEGGGDASRSGPDASSDTFLVWIGTLPSQSFTANPQGLKFGGGGGAWAEFLRVELRRLEHRDRPRSALRRAPGPAV